MCTKPNCQLALANSSVSLGPSKRSQSLSLALFIDSVTHMKISATIEIQSNADGSPITFVCFEDSDRAYWLQFNAESIQNSSPVSYEVSSLDLALVEGLIWSLAVSGSEEVQELLGIMANAREEEMGQFVDLLIERLGQTNVLTETVVTIWHRNSSRYNYAFFPVSKNLILKVLTDMTEGFPEDND